jgi:hypothetical protein
MQGAEGETAVQERIRTRPQSERGLLPIELKMLDILYRLAETAEPIRSDCTGHESAFVPVLFLLIPSPAPPVKLGLEGWGRPDDTSLVDQF